MEGLFGEYSLLLEDNPDPGRILARLYADMEEIEMKKELIILFRKLSLYFGWKKVFSALIDISVMSVNDPYNPVPLLTYFIKKGIENKIDSKEIDLTEYVRFVEERKKEFKHG
jgi:hypothetical protein